jgi:hypothetical protein
VTSTILRYSDCVYRNDTKATFNLLDPFSHQDDGACGLTYASMASTARNNDVGRGSTGAVSGWHPSREHRPVAPAEYHRPRRSCWREGSRNAALPSSTDHLAGCQVGSHHAPHALLLQLNVSCRRVASHHANTTRTPDPQPIIFYCKIIAIIS